MGTWGPGIYQNDLSDDVRAFYRDQLHRGKTGEEITEILLQDYSQELLDVDDCIDFWCALADTQWELGRLTPKVKQKALECIDSPNATLRWKLEGDALVRKRSEVLTQLREKLCQPQPAEKKIKQYKLYQCPWQIGDVFAYQFNSEYAKDNDFFQKYIYFVKVSEDTWHPGHIVPVVYFYKKVDIVLSDITSLRNVDFIPQFYKPIAYKNSPGMEIMYLLTLLNTSSRVIPKNQLTFLGNIGKIKRVDNEDLNSYYVDWKYFETYMIDNFKAWL